MVTASSSWSALTSMPAHTHLIICFVNLLSFILSTHPDHLSVPFSIFVTTFSSMPQRFLITLFHTLFIKVTSAILLKALIFTAIILLSCFFCPTQLQERKPLYAQKRNRLINSKRNYELFKNSTNLSFTFF